MNLRRLAESDLGHILEDESTGFGWPIALTDPDENTINFVGFSDDIAQLIDPETGIAVSGRLASVALRMSSIYNAGMTELPKGIQDTSKKPWVVRFEDVNGILHTFKIIKTYPDRALGLLTCQLESYKI